MYFSIFRKKNLHFDKEKTDKEFKKIKKNKKLIINVTIGRSGSRWLNNIIMSDKKFRGGVERDSFYESFYHFSKYNRLNINYENFYSLIKFRVLEDWKKADNSVICSPYFVFGLEELIAHLKPNLIIICLNDPYFTANSFYRKGMYDEDDKKNYKIPFPIMNENNFNRFFGRVYPVSKKWLTLTRIGKIGWYMNETIKSIQFQLKKNKTKKLLFELSKADQNYNFYQDLVGKIGIKNKINENDFLKIKQKSLTRGSTDNQFNNYDCSFWSKKDHKQFKDNTKFYFSFYKKTNSFLKNLELFKYD